MVAWKQWEKTNKTAGSIHVGVLRIFCRFPAEPPHHRMNPCRNRCAGGFQVSHGALAARRGTGAGCRCSSESQQPACRP